MFDNYNKELLLEFQEGFYKANAEQFQNSCVNPSNNSIYSFSNVIESYAALNLKFKGLYSQLIYEMVNNIMINIVNYPQREELYDIILTKSLLRAILSLKRTENSDFINDEYIKSIVEKYFFRWWPAYHSSYLESMQSADNVWNNKITIASDVSKSIHILLDDLKAKTFYENCDQIFVRKCNKLDGCIIWDQKTIENDNFNKGEYQKELTSPDTSHSNRIVSNFLYSNSIINKNYDFIQGLCNTFKKNICNLNSSRPLIRNYIDGHNGNYLDNPAGYNGRIGTGWILLSQFDSNIADFCLDLFKLWLDGDTTGSTLCNFDDRDYIITYVNHLIIAQDV